MAANDDQISILPGVGMLGLFPHMKYQPWYALGELVDNALQSYAANKQILLASNPDYKLVVKIDISSFEGGSIIVSDNAAGIAEADWERAFRVADPPPDASGLSQFGVGMKAACCWFAKEWSVRTSALGENVARSVRFDIPQIVKSRDETLHVHSESANLESHFTVIEMKNLNRPIAARTIGKIRTYLGGIYRQFLRSGEVSILVKGELVEYSDPAILTAPRYNDDRGGETHSWQKSIGLTLESGKRVQGFVAIREKGNARQAGLALFYRGKVVTGSGEEMYKPEGIFGGGNTFASQRLFGELHMDDFDVTYTKDSLVWHDEEEEFILTLRAELDREPLPILKQANGYRKRDPEPPPTELVTDILDSIEDAFKAVEYELDLVPTEDTRAEVFDISSGSGDPIKSRKMQLDVQGFSWNVELILTSDDAISRWLSVDKVDSASLVLTVNQAHPFMRAWCEIPGQDLEPVWRVAIALGLGQEMARLGGAVLPGLVTQNVNTLLRSVLSRKS